MLAHCGRDIEIIGMETDPTKALRAMRSLRPEVVIVEESERIANLARSFLDSATSGRVIALSLQHGFATVYDHHRIAASDPVDLVQAIQGVSHHPIPGTDWQDGANRSGIRIPAKTQSRRRGAPGTTPSARTTRQQKGG